MPVRGDYYAAADVWKCFPVLGNGVLVAGRREQFERRGGFVVRHVESLSRDGAGLRRFLRVPHTIYRGDPLWVAPLGGEVRTVLSRENPFFEPRRGPSVRRLPCGPRRWPHRRDNRPPSQRASRRVNRIIRVLRWTRTAAS